MAPTFQELFQQLKTMQDRSPDQEALITALERLEQRALPLRRFQGRKQLPTVKVQDRNELLNLHQAVGNAAEQLLNSEQESKELKDMVRKLSALSSQNYKALLQYDPAKRPRSLEAIEEGVRTITLHVGKDELQDNTLGANLSERMPLAFYDEKGNKISGVFTKKKIFQVTAPFFKEMNAAVENAPPEYQDVLRKTVDFFQKNIDNLSGPPIENNRAAQPLVPGQAADNVISLLVAATEKTHEGKKIKAIPLTAAFRSFLPKDLQLQLQPDMLIDLAENLTGIRSELTMNRQAARIPDGGRIDTRNSAMSTVADLLGMPNLVARSKPMKLVDANGVEQEGSFMELAKGFDIKNLPPEADGIDKRSLLRTNGMGFRDLANLQVLDYLCGNVDRHGANLSYQFDKNGKFCGVQAFDNDCSMGDFFMGNRKGRNRMVGTKDMRAIPRSSFNRIMNLTPPMLKYALRGFGLSEPELEAAGQRLNDLQTALSDDLTFYRNHDARNPGQKKLVPGHIRVLEDKDWSKYKMAEFTKDEEGKEVDNLFSLANSQIRKMGKIYEDQMGDFRDLSETIAVGISNRANPSTPARESVKAAGLQKLLNDRSYWPFTSPQYRNMQEAVKRYADYMKQIQNRIKTASSEENRRKSNFRQERDAVVSPEELERMRQLSEQMRSTAQTYLDNKLTNNGQLPRDASDYTKKRVEAARQVLEYGTQGHLIRDEERLQAQANLTEADQQHLQRNRILAAEGPKTPSINPNPEPAIVPQAH